MNRIWFVLIPLTLFMLSCGDNNGFINICFSTVSPNPCFDPNNGGGTTTIINKTTEEVINEQKSQRGFKGELEITDIAKTHSSTPDVECLEALGESELVIKNKEDWNNFRNSCFFSLFSLPDIDFSNQIVMVSIQDGGGMGTKIESVLEFNSGVVVVIKDDESDSLAPGFNFFLHIVSAPREGLPVNFVRVKNKEIRGG